MCKDGKEEAKALPCEDVVQLMSDLSFEGSKRLSESQCVAMKAMEIVD